MSEEDTCDICKTKKSAIGTHGIRDGEVYSVHYCTDCYNEEHRGKKGRPKK